MRTVSADNALRTYQASKRHWAHSTGRYDPLGVCVSPCRGGAVTLPSTYRCPSMRKYQKSIQVCHPERNEVESRDLHTFDVFQLKSVRRSFDSRMLLCDCHRQSFVIFAALCSLRMTDQVDYLDQTNSSFPSGSGRVKTLPYGGISHRVRQGCRTLRRMVSPIVGAGIPDDPTVR